MKDKLVITKENVKEFMMKAREFKKKVTTRAVRMTEPFQVDTSEGPLHCPDGWLAMDKRGYPYPIHDDEFKLIYEEVHPLFRRLK